MTEICMELRLGPKAVLKLLRSGQLVGYRLPGLGRSRGREWRILDPGAQFARYIEERRRHIEHVPLLSGRELAEILRVTPGAIRQMKRRKRVHGTILNGATFYSVSEVRKILMDREEPGRKRYSPILVCWLERLQKDEEYVGADVLDKMLRQVTGLPGNSGYTTELWYHFDFINDLLRAARRGQDAGSAIRMAKSRHQLSSPEFLEGLGRST